MEGVNEMKPSMDVSAEMNSAMQVAAEMIWVCVMEVATEVKSTADKIHLWWK